MTTDRERFFTTLTGALGPAAGRPDAPSPTDEAAVTERAAAVEREASLRAGELLDQLASSAEAGGWVVHRSPDAEDALGKVVDIARGLGARSVVRSGHDALERLGVDGPLAEHGIAVTTMASTGPGSGGPGDSGDGEATGAEGGDRRMRAAAIGADIGLTGADYAVAETGSVVLAAGKGVSRIVSLVPPVHVAIVERGGIVAGLDELFTLLRRDHGSADPASYVNIISGPSRSADIEYTLVTGVHGPGEVHLVLVG